VAITGLGIVSSLGCGVKGHLESIRSGRSGLKPLTLFRLTGLHALPVGEVEEPWLRETQGHRSISLTLKAARQAIGAATLDGPGVVAIGTTTGGIFESEQHYLKHRGREGSQDRALLKHHSIGTIADVLAAMLNLAAERYTFSTACSSSANAVGFGASLVEEGAPWALVGGVDSLCRLTYCGFHALKLLSNEPCRPFDINRRGLSLGEGAAFLLLEKERRAKDRCAPIWGYVGGWGCSSDAYHVTAPHPEGQGAATAMRAALADAGLSPSDVDYVNAHGTATEANDRAEAMALESVFQGLGPLTSSTKGATGHTLGAAGAVEAVISALSLSAGYVPGTVGMKNPDPQLRIRHVPAGGVSMPLGVVLSNSFGFGGNNAALVLMRSSP
jgi:3-oxoacyl-(acyl-carrier-protein) synthase